MWLFLITGRRLVRSLVRSPVRSLVGSVVGSFAGSVVGWLPFCWFALPAPGDPSKGKVFYGEGER